MPWRNSATLTERQNALAAEIDALAARPAAIAAESEALARCAAAAAAERQRGRGRAGRRPRRRCARRPRRRAGPRPRSPQARERRARLRSARARPPSGPGAAARRDRASASASTPDELGALLAGDEAGRRGRRPTISPPGSTGWSASATAWARSICWPSSEAAEVEARLAGLDHERADLTAAIARLRRGIATLDQEGRKRLIAAFDALNEHFGELFTRLFGGGQAELAWAETATTRSTPGSK